LVLGLLLLGALVVQTSVALDAVRPDELVDRQVLSNESDANSIITVQRESFNVALALADWGHGSATARDVQIARALLGQRLNVVTKSGRLTSANIEGAYVDALADLDLLILGLPEVPDALRGQTLRDAEQVIAAFLTQARALNEAFQRFARLQVETLVAANQERQRTQTTLQVAIVTLIGLLSLSIVVGLGRGYRRLVDDLEKKQREVERARRDLDLVRVLDQGVAPLLKAVDSGAPTGSVLGDLQSLLDDLLIGYAWTVPDTLEGSGARVAVRVDAARGPGIVGDDPVGLGPIDADLVTLRAQAVLDALRRREGSLRSAEAARRRDPLTGLANRLGYLDDLSLLLMDSSEQPVLVCFLDIDRFSEVNGALGFAGADEVLIELAGRLGSVIGALPGAVLARLGADEYAVAVPVESERSATRIVTELEAAGTYISDAGGTDASISWSIGETVGHGESDASELMRQAAVAMLLAKESGDRRGHVRYDPVQHERVSATLAEEVAVRNALRSGEFRMYYQPIVDIASGQPLGLESLVRWQRPGVGLLPPSEFLPAIELGGFSVEFGFEVIVEVLAVWKRSLRSALLEVHGPGAYVSINIDAVQLSDPGFEDFVHSALERSGVQPEELVLELTERAAIDQAHAAMLERLRAGGIRIAVDDFGSGFSSLAQSTRLPVDVLKLDRSFITSLLESENVVGLFADMAQLSRTLGVSLIAEGIETSAVAGVLLEAGIVTGQGFLYSAALSEPEIVRWISATADRGVDVGASVVLEG
jgi:diguanylate cyclase (GGDEF)-like protein